MRLYKFITTILLVTFVFFSCNEIEWLEEEAFDFYSVENSYITAEQFKSAIARAQEQLDKRYMYGTYQGSMLYWYTSDMMHGALPSHAWNDYHARVPEHNWVRFLWRDYFSVVSSCNTIISRIDLEGVEIESEAERLALKGEAMFLRAFMYKMIAIMWGGVPLALEEYEAPKRDFTRASQEDVFRQCISDAEFAAANLPTVTELKEEGRITKGAANHLLAELYILVNDWDKAIAAASAVIDGGNYSLMTSRFGTRADEPGDVYWDLFRRGNQNRNGVNTESIWVAQYEYLVAGGGVGRTSTRFCIPMYSNLKGDVDGEFLFIGRTNKNGGSGMSWMTPSPWFLGELWQDDPDDMRMSEYNIITDLIADNPESAYYGQKIIESGAITNFPNLYLRYWHPIISKNHCIGNYPDEVILVPETGLLHWTANADFRDHYYMRLGETYLLRAEAKLGKGDQAGAAADINIVRARANAIPVAPGDVDIDYILDERCRELYMEEPRALTLARVGKLVERVSLYNSFHNGLWGSNFIEDFHALWPIPQSEIERNTEAVIEQNPGY